MDKNTFTDAIKNVGDKVGDIKDKVTDDLAHAKDTASKTCGHIHDVAEDKLGDVKEIAQDKFDDAKKVVGEKCQEAKDKACEMHKDGVQYVKDNPEKSIGAAVGIGAVIGAVTAFLFGRKK